MIGTLVSIIGVLLVFACLVAYNYIMDLRRERATARDEAKTAWRLYDASNRELAAVKGLPVPDPYFTDTTANRNPQTQTSASAPFVPTGIGPTAISDRELRRERQEQAARTGDPELTRHPTAEQIAAAAREATRNNGN